MTDQICTAVTLVGLKRNIGRTEKNVAGIDNTNLPGFKLISIDCLLCKVSATRLNNS
jgi:hypothetical protein